MRETRQTFIILTIFSLVIFQSCRRCDPETFTITDKSKNYFLQGGNGSIYIYQNLEDSTDFDTLTVVDIKGGLDFHYTESECDGDYWEYIRYSLVSNVQDTLYINIGTHNNDDNYSLRGKFKKQNLNCYYRIDKKSGSFENYTKDGFEILPNYTVKSKNYKDVIKITHNQFKPYNGEAPVYYHCNGIGLIEFRAPDMDGNNLKTFYLKEYIKK